jgi:hypothetical protein
LCGKTDHDRDDVFDDASFIRWGYKRRDGLTQGGQCYYCERIYSGKHSHLKDRGQTQAEMKMDKAKHDQFLADRACLVESMRKGKETGSLVQHGLWSTRREGAKPVKLFSEEGFERALDRPPDDFLPLEEYKEFHGDPNQQGEQEARPPRRVHQ